MLKRKVQALTDTQTIILTFVLAILPPVIAYISDPTEPVRTLIGAILGAVLATALKYLGQTEQ